VFHPNTESELSTRPRKRGHLEIEIYVENLNKKLFGLTKDGPYHTDRPIANIRLTLGS